MTDFVIHALQFAASQAIERGDRVRLSVLDQEAFANALIASAKPNAALENAQTPSPCHSFRQLKLNNK